MVPVPTAIESNKLIPSAYPDGLVAVFVGGTSGVGEYTVKALAKYSSKLRVYIVGRSEEAATKILAECRQSCPNGKFEFIKANVSAMKGVDDVCRQIKQKETFINLLFLSQGSMGFTQKTPDGLPLSFCLAVHSRMRFILNLLPLIQSASTLRRVVCVLAASCEGAIDVDNLACQGFSLFKQRDQVASIESLMLRRIAERAPDVSFVHNVPGAVPGGIQRDAEGGAFLNSVMFIMKFVRPFVETSPDECGKMQLFFSTSSVYQPRDGAKAHAGLPLPNQVEVAKGSNGRVGSGMYSITNKGESSPEKVVELLAKFEEDGTAEKVWQSVMGDMKRITGSDISN